MNNKPFMTAASLFPTPRPWLSYIEVCAYKNGGGKKVKATKIWKNGEKKKVKIKKYGRLGEDNNANVRHKEEKKVQKRRWNRS